MRKCSSTILYAVCTFRPYKSTPVLKLFRTFTGRMTKGLSLRMVFSLLFQDTLFIGGTGRGSATSAQPGNPREPGFYSRSLETPDEVNASTAFFYLIF